MTKLKTFANRFPLLAQAIAAGDVVALFPLFKDWSKEDLRALLLESEQASELSDEEFRSVIFRPEVFFNGRLAQATQDAHMDTMMKLSEVCSVALYYLGAQA